MSDLLPDQEELLIALVEASRRVPRPEQQFRLEVFTTDQVPNPIEWLTGAGITLEVLGADVWELYDRELIQGQWFTDGRATGLTVTSAGYAAYEEIRRRSNEPAQALEEELRRHLDGERFRERYPDAYERWSAAEKILWSADASSDLTTIGHKLREAVQQFATALVSVFQPPDADTDPAKTKNRLRSVVEQQRPALGDRRAGLLDALMEYADAVNGVVQRLEHADQKEGDPATWEDARAAVFQTANLLFEFDRTLR